MKLPNKFTFIAAPSEKIYTATAQGQNRYHITWDGCDEGIDYSISYIEGSIKYGDWTMIDNLDHIQLNKFDRVVLSDDTNRVFIFQTEETGCSVLIDVVAGNSCAITTVLLEQLLFTVHAAPEAVVEVLDTDKKGVLKYESELAKSLNKLLDERGQLYAKLTGLQRSIQLIDDEITEITK